MFESLILIRATCLACALVGAALALAVKNDDNFAPTIIGIVIFVVSMIGVYSLGGPCMDAQKEEAESGTEYKAAHHDEIKSFVNCHKENGYNVCETKDGKEMIVEHYWKKGESKKNKKEEKQILKYKGAKDSEIKKYTSCEDEENGPVCTAEDGTKHEVDSYWRFKTQKEKEDESSGTIIAPIIPSIVVH